MSLLFVSIAGVFCLLVGGRSWWKPAPSPHQNHRATPIIFQKQGNDAWTLLKTYPRNNALDFFIRLHSPLLIDGNTLVLLTLLSKNASQCRHFRIYKDGSGADARGKYFGFADDPNSYASGYTEGWQIGSAYIYLNYRRVQFIQNMLPHVEPSTSSSLHSLCLVSFYDSNNHWTSRIYNSNNLPHRMRELVRELSH